MVRVRACALLCARVQTGPDVAPHLPLSCTCVRARVPPLCPSLPGHPSCSVERDHEAELGEAIRRRDATIDKVQEANMSLTVRAGFGGCRRECDA